MKNDGFPALYKKCTLLHTYHDYNEQITIAFVWAILDSVAGRRRVEGHLHG
jgi:hypothetical protein